MPSDASPGWKNVRAGIELFKRANLLEEKDGQKVQAINKPASFPALFHRIPRRR
jgi:hypothetical protein